MKDLGPHYVHIPLHRNPITLFKTSALSGKINSMVLPITYDRLLQWERSRELIQNAFPDLTNDQREFILTGSTPEEWDRAFPEEDEQPEDEALAR